MDLTKFNYPMFSTTDREKEILRMVELTMVGQTYFKGLCINIFKLFEASKITDTEYSDLRAKISITLGPKFRYLDGPLFTPHYSPTHQVRILIRRIWITKLLNYKG